LITNARSSAPKRNQLYILPPNGLKHLIKTVLNVNLAENG
jgi:hypothetical protein